MARGLSDLQLWILERAARFRYVRYADVMLNYFNWEPEKPPKFYGQRRTVTDEATGESRVEVTPPDMVGMPIYDEAVFNPDKIGRNKYNSAMASLSRCCRRLQARGLVQILHGTYAHIA